ncbi:hypothetical protein GQ600_25768 [Phytophthora cactorum]|nr:hypothetical protein GQ600_25768 [Phytophthora cactorum]
MTLEAVIQSTKRRSDEASQALDGIMSIIKLHSRVVQKPTNWYKRDEGNHASRSSYDLNNLRAQIWNIFEYRRYLAGSYRQQNANGFRSPQYCNVLLANNAGAAENRTQTLLCLEMSMITVGDTMNQVATSLEKFRRQDPGSLSK